MSSGTMYLVFAGIVLVVAVVVMMVWTTLHMRGTETGTKAKPARQKKSRRDKEKSAPIQATPIDEESRKETPIEAPPDHDDSLHFSLETIDTIEKVLHEELPHEANFFVEEESSVSEESSVPEDHARTIEDISLDDDVENASDRLKRILQTDDVLGWLTVFPDGRRGLRAQEYDETVIDLFATLAQQVKYTAEVVGLEHAKEFVVRGEEGTIVIFPAARLDAVREDFVVLFMQVDVVEATRITERLLQNHL